MTPAEIAAARKRLGLSLTGMAAALTEVGYRCDRQTYWRWEQGQQEPEQPAMLRLALERLAENARLE